MAQLCSKIHLMYCAPHTGRGWMDWKCASGDDRDEWHGTRAIHTAKFGHSVQLMILYWGSSSHLLFCFTPSFSSMILKRIFLPPYFCCSRSGGYKRGYHWNICMCILRKKEGFSDLGNWPHCKAMFRMTIEQVAIGEGVLHAGNSSVVISCCVFQCMVVGFPDFISNQFRGYWISATRYNNEVSHLEEMAAGGLMMENTEKSIRYKAPQ